MFLVTCDIYLSVQDISILNIICLYNIVHNCFFFCFYESHLQSRLQNSLRNDKKIIHYDMLQKNMRVENVSTSFTLI